MSSNTNIGNTPVNQGYVQLIHMGETGGIDGTLRALYDGDGTASDLLIASDKVKISTTLYIGSKTLTEFVQDTVGTMFSSNTETNITVTYQDADGTIDLVSSGEVTLTGSETLTNKTLTSPVINTGISGSAILDSDTMSGASATKLSSSESIKAYVDTEVAGIVSSAPSTLDTLNELAAALGDDANFSTTVTNSIATKLPLAGGQMTGNITFSGSQTVDGRDVSADGSKLDGIEASATADQSNAEIRTAVEAATDSNVFTDADHSKLNAIEASADVTDTANVTSAGALMDSEVTDLDGIKSLTVPNDTTISATAKTLLDDANVGAMRNTLGLGTLAIKDNIDDIDQIAAGVKLVAGESFVDSDDNLMTAAAIDDRINSAVTASTYSFTLSDGSNTQPIASGNTLTMTGSTGIDVVVGATDTATLTFDGSELPDMTDAFAGTDEFIVLDGTTSKRKAANEIRLTTFDDTGFSTITIDGTTANGVLTYGGTNNIDTEANLTFDGSTLAVTGAITGSSTLNITGTATLQSYLDFSGTDNRINNTTNDLKIVQYANDKDIIFYNDDGSGGITTYLTLDGSASLVDFSVNSRHIDDKRAFFGNDSDLQIHHNSNNNSYIENNTGNLYIRNYADDSDIVLESDNGSGGTTAYLTLDGSAGLTKANKDIKFLDGIKALFGDSSDIQIYHNGGGNSNIDNLTGDLYVTQYKDDGSIYFRTDDGSGGVIPYITLRGDLSKVVLHEDTILAAAKKLYLDGGGDTYIHESAANVPMLVSGGAERFRVTSAGDVVFNENGNSTDFRVEGNTDANLLFVDGSADRVGIGTTSPAQKLHVDGSIRTDSAYYVDGNIVINTDGNFEVHDTRAVTPSTDLGLKGVRFDFKNNSADGLSDGGSYHGVMTFQQWGDTSGGHIHALGFTDNGYVHHRNASIGGTFGNWKKLIQEDESGNVGIGVSPAQKLHVAGNVMISNNQFFIGEDADGDDINLLGIHSNNNCYVGPSSNAWAGGAMLYGAASTTNAHVWYEGNAERMRIADNGFLGIGTASPSALLDVGDRIHLQSDGVLKWGASANAGNLTWDTGVAIVGSQSGIDLDLRAAGGKNILFKVSSSEKMRIDSSGNVGIGINSPAANLDVAGSGGTDGATGSPTIRLSNTVQSADWDTGDVVGTLEYYAADASGNAPYVTSFIKSVNGADGSNGTLPSGALTFGVASYNLSGGAVEKMRIDSTGNVGIGTTSPSEKLDVVGSAEINGLLYVSDSNDIPVRLSSTDAGFAISMADSNSASATHNRIGVTTNYMTFHTNNAEAMRIEADQDVHFDQDVIAFSTTPSDIRLKKNFTKIENGLDVVNKLEGHTFNWKKGGDRLSAGFKAQEVEKILPHLVDEKKLPLKADDDKEYKILRYEEMIPYLVEAIKEQQKQIDELRKGNFVIETGD